MKTKSNYVSKKPNIQGFVEYTDDEHATWKMLYDKQMELIPGRACSQYIDGLAKLGLSSNAIPQLPDVNGRLRACTGWEVAPVAALIGFDKFFGLLADKKFPAATFIRRKDELKYLQEPDIFHEIFGHCPMLTDPTYANFMEAYGKAGVDASPYEQRKLAALYWFTVEFGLIETPEGLRIYGGGILSSIGETVYALESNTPKRLPLEAIETFRTPYRIDIYQPVYFVIKQLSELYDLSQIDLKSLIIEAKTLGMRAPLFPPKEG